MLRVFNMNVNMLGYGCHIWHAGLHCHTEISG